MARIARVVVPDLPQRGNPCEPVFFAAEDYRLYRGWSPRQRGAPMQPSGPIA
jgi:hypothetical protein